MKSSFPLHVIFFALFPVTFLYVSNADQTTFSVVWPALLVAPLLGIAVYWVIKKLWVPNSVLAGLVATPSILIFFGYGHLYGALYGPFLTKDSSVSLPVLGEVPLYGSLLGLFLLAMLVFVYRLWIRAVLKPDFGATKVQTLLNVMSGVLILLQPVSFMGVQPDVEHYERNANKIFGAFASESTKVKSGDVNLPDIYYIVPDGYARPDVLQKHYDFDNREFLDTLQKEGFQTAQKSYASFYWTFLSLGSTLNMHPVNGYAELLGPRGESRDFPYYMVRNNGVLRYLKTLGYDYIQTSSTWGATLVNPFADRVIPCQHGGLFQQEYYRVLVETSLLRPVLTSVGTDLATCHLNNFVTLGRLAQESSSKPKFVFTHIVPPHHPYLFDRHGNILKYATVANQFDFQAGLWGKKAQYLEQILFINKKLIETVHTIKSNPKRPVIIVIASDHGPHLIELPKQDMHRARLANFVSVYSSDPSYRLPDPISLPNLFRSIFIQQFGAKMEMLPQRSFFSKYARPYAFKEVDIPDFKASKR